MKRWNITILLAIPVFAQVEPLDDALWKGTATITVAGDIQNQFLANSVNAAGSPVGFKKEKASLLVDVKIELEFQVNALGEMTFVLKEQGKLVEDRRLEHKYIEIEEQTLEGGIKAPLQVQYLETGTSHIDYEGESEHDHHQFSLGLIRITPTGNMKKKGKMQLEGDITLRYAGTGEYQRESERHPPSDEYARLFEDAKLNRTLVVPIKFSANLTHKKEPVQAAISVRVVFDNPFDHDPEERGRDILTDNLKTSGSVTLDPLF